MCSIVEPPPTGESTPPPSRGCSARDLARIVINRPVYGQNVLDMLLPGLRALRAPLIAGYLWLLGLWLLIAPHLHPAEHPDSVVGQLDRLGHAAGRVPVAIAVSVAAYLLGVVSIAANPVLNQIGNPLAATRLRAIMPRAMWRRVDSAITILVRARLDDRFRDDAAVRDDAAHHLRAAQALTAAELPALPSVLAGSPDAVVEQALAAAATRRQLLDGLMDLRPVEKACFRELMLTPIRIIGHDSDLYQIYDQNRAEHELRLGLVLPLAFLSITLAVLASPWWAFGMVAAEIMLYLGVSANIEATTVLTGSIGVNRLTLPALDQLATGALPWREPAAARRALSE